MLEDQTRARARKGTKSCTECRRRKVRCIRLPEDAQTCRSCEERGSGCIPQEYSSQHVRPHRISSRHRISQLESKVASLSKVVRGIELKLGHQPTETPETVAEQTSGVDASDDDPSVSDIVTSGPSHLRSLFQNDWLSVDMQPQHESSQVHKARSTANLTDIARQALQKLIPPKQEVSDIAISTFEWLHLLETLYPQPMSVKSKQEILEAYEDMHKPDVDALRLASWLVALAVTVQQSPQEGSSPPFELGKYYQKWLDFSRAVSDTVERSILCHDVFTCSIQGLAIGLHFFRLLIIQGNFQKAWIQLRRYIAIAELIGLPKTFQAIQLSTVTRGDVDEMQHQRALLWGSLCALDRLFGMFTNLPPGTTRYQQNTSQPLVLDGIVQLWAYLTRLTDIAAKIQQQDDINTAQGLSRQLYTTALELASQLRSLAAETPDPWWVRKSDSDQVKPDDIVQFVHQTLLMRVYLPFTLQQSTSDTDYSSRLACMAACEEVVQRYQFLRRRLPSGFILAHILDLQAFSATVVLLLTTHGPLPADLFRFDSDKARIESEVAQVVKLMGEKANDITRSQFARNGVATICSLSRLLQQDDNVSQELTLKVPLLGKVHIRRNVGASLPPPEIIPSRSQTASLEPGLWNSNGQVALQQPPSVQTNAYVEPTLQTQQDWQWDNFSWSVENNQDYFFQDALMTDFDQFVTWQNTDLN